MHKTHRIIYHAGCADGYTAAWVVFRYLTLRKDDPIDPDAIELTRAFYDSRPPDVTDQHVWVVDFSYPFPLMEEVAAQSASLLVLDHHNSVAEDVKSLPYFHFDNSQSGAALAKEWVEAKGYEDPLIGPICAYVQDRDLWQWKLEDSREVSAYIALQEHQTATWDDLASAIYRDFPQVVETGGAILAYEAKQVGHALKAAKPAMLLGYAVYAVNTSVLPSEIGNQIMLMDDSPDFAVMYQEKVYRGERSIRVSLRSTDDSVDVSEIAAHFGGGGHRNAAGFNTTPEKFYEELKYV